MLDCRAAESAESGVQVSGNHARLWPGGALAIGHLARVLQPKVPPSILPGATPMGRPTAATTGRER